MERIQRGGPDVGRMFHQIPDSLGPITDRHTNSLFGYASFSVIALCKHLHLAHSYRSLHANRPRIFFPGVDAWAFVIRTVFPATLSPQALLQYFKKNS